MASTRKSTHYMEKGDLFWQIENTKTRTVSKGGKLGTDGKELSSKDHPSTAQALQYVLKQINDKTKRGYVLKKPKKKNVRENMVKDVESSGKKVTSKTNKTKADLKAKGKKIARKTHNKTVEISSKLPKERFKKSRLCKQGTIVLARDKSFLTPVEKRQLLKRASQFGNWSLSRIPSLTVGPEELYIPSRNEWPLSIVAPVIWECVKPSCYTPSAYALYVNDDKCMFGDEEGRVIELDHTGNAVRIYKLHSGVKCIVRDGEFLYAGCNDGGLYDLTNEEARLVCRAEAFGEVYWLDVWQGYLVASDANGQLAMINPGGKMLWKKQSSGVGGWMVRMDSTGVYHGHSGGVTKYEREQGIVLWHTQLDSGSTIYFGVQDSTSIQIADNKVIRKIEKDTGKIVRNYLKEDVGDLMSNEVGGSLVFAGGSQIVCYDERTADVVYKLQHSDRPLSMQYYSGRLFCVGKAGLTVIDLSEDAVKTTKKGNKINSIKVDINKNAPVVSPLERVASVSGDQIRTGVLLQCFHIDGNLHVRPISDGYNRSWDCQFPLHIRKPGTKYVVDEIKPSVEGGCYRVIGSIREIEG